MGRSNNKDSTVASDADNIPTGSIMNKSSHVHNNPNINSMKNEKSSNSPRSKTNEDLYPNLDSNIEPSAPLQDDVNNNNYDISNDPNAKSSELDLKDFPAENSNSTISKPPINDNGELDLSKYRNSELISSIDRLTSIPYQLKSLLLPSFKIGTRALLSEDNDVTLKSLFTDLNPHLNNDEKIRKKEENKRLSMERKQKKSMLQRIIYFLFIGIPSAILVGFVYGIIVFLSSLLKDLYSLFTNGFSLLNYFKNDVTYFRNNPNKLPSQEKTVDSITNQVVMPYAKTIIKKKLGPFSFMATPANYLLNKIIPVTARNTTKLITIATTKLARIPTVQRATNSVKEKASNLQQRRNKREL